MKITIDLTYRGETIDSHEKLVVAKKDRSRTIEIKVDEIIDKAIRTGTEMKKMAKVLSGLVRKSKPKKPRLAMPRKKKEPRK